ncbi:MAG: hypothetical protein HUU48_09105 [Flavobacteriales bacterium]|nr:hypothetical protein [Flavobacteriales bacterium]
MKNKKALYYLLPVNILVWGFAIYRIVSYGNETNSAALTETGKIPEVFVMPVPDTFSLLLNYPDPFLKKSSNVFKTSSANKIQHKETSKKVETTEKKQALIKQLPTIVYKGMVRNQKTEKAIALVSIEGKELSWVCGETQQGLKLLQILPDSIKIGMNKKTMYVKR